ncbi:terminase TerL endonuclease subunit [Brevibacterium otitidis]
MSSMTSQPAVRTGAQRPRIEHVPPAVTPDGDEAVALAEAAGISLDPWQEYVLRQSLGRNELGKWSAFEVGLIVARQNGKNIALEARELAGALLFGEQLIVHSAHEASTANEAFKKLKARIQEHPFLLKRVRGYRPGLTDWDDLPGFRLSNQERAIEFKNGSRIVYRTRTSGGGRGLSGDLVILDEAYAVTSEQIAALLPTMAARSMTGNPQIWYTSSAGLVTSEVLRGLRMRGIEHVGAERLAYFEWSAPDDADHLDRNTWYQANPALGIHISEDYVAAELAAFTAGEEDGGLTGFRRERLSIWETQANTRFITEKMLDATTAPADEVEDVEVLAFGVDISPRRDIASVALAGYLPDGRIGVTLVDRREGTSWLPHRLGELRRDWDPVAVAGLAGSVIEDLLPQLRRSNVRTRLVTWKRYAQAAARFYDDLLEKQIVHSGQVEVLDAFANVTSRGGKDSLWTWSRIEKHEDITPVISMTLAVEALLVRGKRQLEGKRSGGRVVAYG